MTRGIRRLHALHKAPILLQEASNASSLQSRNTVYANAAGSCALVCPPEHGTHVLAQVSDAHFVALILSNGIAFVSVYLPDSAKTDQAFEAALDEVNAGLEFIRSRHHPRAFVLGGDFNVQLSFVPDSNVMGTCHWPAYGPRYTERQDMILGFCARNELVHGPSHVDGNPMDRWTRESWGIHCIRTSLDHVFVSSCLRLVRWTPWPERAYSRHKRRLWGDHRPILAVAAPTCAAQSFDMESMRPPVSNKGWSPAGTADLHSIYRALCLWLERNASSLL